jgi:hypothetical protein
MVWRLGAAPRRYRHSDGTFQPAVESDEPCGRPPVATSLRARGSTAGWTDGQMLIDWRRDSGKSEYYYGEIPSSKVTAQIGRSTNAGRYIWTIFHEDIGCAIVGSEEPSLEEAKVKAQEWVDLWVKQ